MTITKRFKMNTLEAVNCRNPDNAMAKRKRAIRHTMVHKARQYNDHKKRTIRHTMVLKHYRGNIQSSNTNPTQ